MADYYTTTQRKVIDFIIGFFGIGAANTVLFFGYSIFGQLITPILQLYSFNYFLIGYIAILILNIASIICAFRFKRKYIGIGMISGLAIPLLVFGACVAIISLSF